MSYEEKDDKKLIITLLIDIILLCMGHALNIKAIILASLILCIFITLYYRKTKLLAIILFYLPWSPIMKLSQNSFSFHTLIVPFFFVYSIIFKEHKFEKLKFSILDVIIIISLIIFTLMAILINQSTLSKDYMIFILMLIFTVLYLKTYKNKINFEQCILFLTIGVITASIASNILMEIPHMKSYINVYEWKQEELIRLSGFYSDSNFYTVHIIISIAGLLIIAANKNIKDMIWIGLVIVLLVYFGMRSVSKMFIILFIVTLLIWIIFILITKGKITQKVSIITFVILSLILILESSFFEQLINMYIIRFNQIDNMSNLTSGRSNIWVSYFDTMANNMSLLILGNGYAGVRYGLTMAAHNTLIQIIYEFGIIGSTIIAIWIAIISKIYKVHNRLNISKFILISMFIIACFGPFLSLDMLFFDDFFYIIIIFFIGREYIYNKL